MPMYDRQCKECGYTRLDCYEQREANQDTVCPDCGEGMHRVLLPGSTSNVIGDEIDVTVAQVVASNPDGSPRRFTSRQELKRVTEANGWTNLVEHRPGKGTDKSKTTVRWT